MVGITIFFWIVFKAYRHLMERIRPKGINELEVGKVVSHPSARATMERDQAVNNMDNTLWDDQETASKLEGGAVYMPLAVVRRKSISK
jgi:hypothetical protein